MVGKIPGRILGGAVLVLVVAPMGLMVGRTFGSMVWGCVTMVGLGVALSVAAWAIRS
ncbi:hypothetical protein ACFWAY_25285 [Rhodococcus sp. NPDC059968]|uniref:hypothetical protein n=1 Tax=Rhodococcus sp. NPDC059968 TaxID=3347017 RepID=UPI00366F3C8A